MDSPDPSPSAKTDYFPPLTGIRAIAAAMVYFLHFNPIPATKWGQWGEYLYRFIAEFHVGVTIFFVLSGFLICHRYQTTVSWNRKWWSNYWVNRFARIYPVYFLATCISTLPWLTPHPIPGQVATNWQVLLLNLTFLRGLFDEYKFTCAPAGWSLTVEEIFYLLFPLIILLANRIKLWYQPILFLAAGIAGCLIFRNIPFYGFFASPKFLFEFTFFGRCFEFYTGIALARHLHKKPILPATCSLPLKTAGGLAWITLCIAGLAWNKSLHASQPQFLIYETLLNNFLLPPGIALLFYGLVSEKSTIRRFLSSKPMILLGKSSYVFYLFHNILFARIYEWTHHKPLPVFFIIHIVTILIYLFFERPLNKWIRHRFSSKSLSPVPSPS